MRALELMGAERQFSAVRRCISAEQLFTEEDDAEDAEAPTESGSLEAAK